MEIHKYIKGFEWCTPNVVANADTFTHVTPRQYCAKRDCSNCVLTKDLTNINIINKFISIKVV